MRKKSVLWTKDFSRITAATVLSIIGGEAINLPISLLVFEKTGSTLLSALIMICSFLPDVVFAVLLAPFVDKGNKKRWLITLDSLLIGVYLAMYFITKAGSFVYSLYVLFTLLTASISVLYRLVYNAWYPDLIAIGFEQKGFAVSATLYPLVIIVMSPVSTFLYSRLAISDIFLYVSLLLLLSLMIEAGIHYEHKKGKAIRSLRVWKQEVIEGFHYFKKEKGIRNIYSNMSIMQGTSEGTRILIQAFYQTRPTLTVTLLGFLKSAEMIGRLVSGMLQYKIELPRKKRYAFTCVVYTVYQLADMILLYTGYPLMLVNRFLCGGLGTVSATIRNTAVNSYLPPGMRARVHAMFEMMIAVSAVVFQFFSGWLGQVMPYRAGILVLGFIYFVALFFLIILPREDNRKVYEAERKKEEA